MDSNFWAYKHIQTINENGASAHSKNKKSSEINVMELKSKSIASRRGNATKRFNEQHKYFGCG